MNKLMKSAILLTTYSIVIMVLGILCIGLLDGFWDAFGVFLIIWSNNIGYKRHAH